MASMLVELQREIRQTSWSVEDRPDRRPFANVTQARWHAVYCDTLRDGYVCTRAKGHGGRHLAGGLGDNVCAVWPQEVDEPCS